MVVVALSSEGMHEDGGSGRTQQRGDAQGWWLWSHTAASGCRRLVAVVAHSTEGMKEDGGDGPTHLAARSCRRTVAIGSRSSEGMHEDGGGGRTQQRGDAG